MASDDVLASSERTRGHLARAWVKLPIGVDTDQYQEYLDHNELELAMKAPARLGETGQATPARWQASSEIARRAGRISVAFSYTRYGHLFPEIDRMAAVQLDAIRIGGLSDTATIF